VKNIQTSFAVVAILCLPAICAAQPVPAYTINTVVGNNTAGFSGDGAAATAAEIDGPAGIWLDSKGNLYLADSFNNRIRMVTASNLFITTVVGNGTAGFAGDTLAATNASTEIDAPDSVIVDSKGNLYLSDTANNVVRQVNSSGTISSYAGENSLGAGYSGDGGKANVAQLETPAGLALDSGGNLYISDSYNDRIRMVNSSTGIITTVAGSTNAGFSGNGGSATAAKLNRPRGLTIDANGALYIADSANNEIRKVVKGTITLVAGNSEGLAGYGGDGSSATGTSAYLREPTAVAVDTCGNLYIADTTNSRIRMVTADGILHTIAGTGITGFSGDGGPALSARLNFPTGIAVDSKGNVYVSDTQNAVIRELTPNSAVPCGAALPVVTPGGVIGASAFGASTTVAPGSWIEIYGSNLAVDSRYWTTADFTNNGMTAPISLDSTFVTIGGQSAYVYAISSGQVNAQVPANTGTGTLQLTVTTAAGTSAPVNVTVATVQPALWAPAIFKVGGNQYVGAQHQDGTFVGPPGAFGPSYTSSYAKPGETITLWGIGFGTVNPGIAPGQVAQGLSTLTSPVTFNFGSATVVPIYYGLGPDEVGLYQFNLQIPTVPNSDLVPLTFVLGSGSLAVNSSQTLYTAVHN
jgi:uncharacterized protein (TIGR03437 family)